MSVEESWARIMGWLDSHAPATAAHVQPAAEPAKITTVAALFPHPWPADLRSWYALHGGEDMRVLWSGVLPGWAPLSLDGIADSAAMYKQIFDNPDFAELADEPGQAGDPAWTFLPEFVPIADNGAGCTLFVDTRPGELSGCVTGFMREDAAVDGPSWNSVSAMLEDVADALEQGRPCDGWQPSVVDDRMDWQFVG